LIIRDLLAEIFRPLTFKNSFNLGRNSSNIFSLVGLVIIMSSTNLIGQHPFKSRYAFVAILGELGRTISSKPFKTMLHNNGEITPP